MSEMSTTVRRTVTKRATKWARTADGIVLRWEEYPDNPRTLSALRLDDRLRRVFVSACCRSALLGGLPPASPAWKSVQEVLEALEEVDEGEVRASAQVSDAVRLSWFGIATGQWAEAGTALDEARLPLALVYGLACTRRWLRYADVCDAASHAARVVSRRVKRRRASRRQRSNLEGWGQIAEPGTASAHSREVASAEADERTRQGQLLAGIVGPEWHLAPEWRTDTAVQIARGIYESRDFGTMPILADALEDVGCSNAAWLARMRDTNWPWCRGCHVLDSLLLLGADTGV